MCRQESQLWSSCCFYFNGFYEQIVSFIRSLFESALKTNESLEFSIVTGCLRISKVSVLDKSYAEYFRFTQDEVDNLLKDYGIAYKKDEVKKWYDDYVFGSTEVYNPWSVINYTGDIVHRDTDFPKPYWSNTSSNSIVQISDVITGQLMDTISFYDYKEDYYYRSDSSFLF